MRSLQTVGFSVLWGCATPHLGLPVDTGDWARHDVDWGELDDACTPENEPNEFRDGDPYDLGGLLHAGRPIAFCGRLSSTGTNSDGIYSGDRDVLLVEVRERLQIKAHAVSESGGEIDMFVYKSGEEEPRAVYGGGPWSGTVNDTVFFVFYSPEGPPVDYRFDAWVR